MKISGFRLREESGSALSPKENISIPIIKTHQVLTSVTMILANTDIFLPPFK